MSGYRKASATGMVDSDSISVRSKTKDKNLVFTASVLDVQQLKGQCEAFHRVRLTGGQVAA